MLAFLVFLSYHCLHQLRISGKIIPLVKASRTISYARMGLKITWSASRITLNFSVYTKATFPAISRAKLQCYSIHQTSHQMGNAYKILQAFSFSIVSLSRQLEFRERSFTLVRWEYQWLGGTQDTWSLFHVVWQLRIVTFHHYPEKFSFLKLIENDALVTSVTSHAYNTTLPVWHCWRHIFDMTSKRETVGMDVMRLGAALAVIRNNDGFNGLLNILDTLFNSVPVRAKEACRKHDNAMILASERNIKCQEETSEKK